MRRGRLTGTLSILSSLNHLKQPFIDVTCFRLSKSLYSRSINFKLTNNFGFYDQFT